MIYTTTPHIDGKKIVKNVGIVHADVIIGANIISDIFAGIRDIVGGRSQTYEKKFKEAKKMALQELGDEAKALGANAIVGIDFDFETIGASASMLMVAVSGTAVVIED